MLQLAVNRQPGSRRGTRRASPLPEKPLSLHALPGGQPHAHPAASSLPLDGKPAARQCNRLLNRTAAHPAGRTPKRSYAEPTSDLTSSRPSAQPSDRPAGHTPNHPAGRPPHAQPARNPADFHNPADFLLSRPHAQSPVRTTTHLSSRQTIQLATYSGAQKAGRLVG